MLHVGETTISVPFSKEQAQQLDASFQQLLKTVSVICSCELNTIRGLHGVAISKQW